MSSKRSTRIRIVGWQEEEEERKRKRKRRMVIAAILALLAILFCLVFFGTIMIVGFPTTLVATPLPSLMSSSTATRGPTATPTQIPPTATPKLEQAVAALQGTRLDSRSEDVESAHWTHELKAEGTKIKKIIFLCSKFLVSSLDNAEVTYGKVTNLEVVTILLHTDAGDKLETNKVSGDAVIITFKEAISQANFASDGVYACRVFVSGLSYATWVELVDR